MVQPDSLEYQDKMGLPESRGPRVTRVNQESATVCIICFLELADLESQVVKTGYSQVLRGLLDHRALQVLQAPRALLESQAHRISFLRIQLLQERKAVAIVPRVYQVCLVRLVQRARREIRGNLAFCPWKDANGVLSCRERKHQADLRVTAVRVLAHRGHPDSQDNQELKESQVLEGREDLLVLLETQAILVSLVLKGLQACPVSKVKEGQMGIQD